MNPAQNTSQTTVLYMTEGSADKEYHALLQPKDGGWVVDYKNGRRGKALRHGTKTPEPIGYEQAMKTYEKLVASKKKDGYTEAQDGRTFQAPPEGKEHSGVRAQLLKDVDLYDTQTILELLSDPNWAMQQKHDGERRFLIKDNERSLGAQRDGWIVPLSTQTEQELLALPHKRLVFDGEDMGEHHVLFDLLELDAQDYRSLPFSSRCTDLQALIKQAQRESPQALNTLRLAPTAFTETEKRALFQRLWRAGQEGVVFKHVSDTYEAGMTKQIKVKFKAEATCQVISRHETKNSAAIAVARFDLPGRPTLEPVGNVTLAPNSPVKVGDLIEVQYLYAFAGGSLFQPVFKSIRTDKSEPDTLGALKFKAESLILDPRAPDHAPDHARALSEHANEHVMQFFPIHDTLIDAAPRPRPRG